jgi:hypothetical protein
MVQSNQSGESKPNLLAFYFNDDPEKVREKGELSFSQGMNPHYRIEVVRNLGPNMKIGLLYSFNVEKQIWTQLRKFNIGDDMLYKAKQESLSKPHYLYIKDLGVWKVDGLIAEKDSTMIQITRFAQS